TDSWRADGADDPGNPVEVVALVAGMALHRVGGVAGIEVLQADGDALFVGIAGDLLERLDAVGGRLVAGNGAARGIVGVPPLVAGEGDDVREAGIGTGIDHLLGAGDDLVVIAGVIVPLGERHAADAV